jgi:copper chaperone NosL
MLVADHPGPKGQIFLEGAATPIWFTSVRDTLAFTRLPEEPKNLAAIYVNDMGKAANWEHPGPGTWIAASGAFFVAGSDARGGMGAPEIVPFGDRSAADRFRAEHGGEIYALDEVPEHYVLGAREPATGGDGHAGHAGRR